MWHNFAGVDSVRIANTNKAVYSNSNILMAKKETIKLDEFVVLVRSMREAQIKRDAYRMQSVKSAEMTKALSRLAAMLEQRVDETLSSTKQIKQ